MFSKKNSPVRGSFSLRLALIYTSALCFSCVALLSVTYQLVRHVTQSRDRDVIQAQTIQYKALFERGGLSAISAAFEQPSDLSSEKKFVRIVEADGQVAFMTVSHPLWHLLDQKNELWNRLSTGTAHWDELFRDDEPGSWIVGTTPLMPGLFLQVGRSNTESRLVLIHFRNMTLFIMLPAAVLSLLIGWLTTRSAVAPLRSLIETIRCILETGDLKQRVPSHAQRGELGALTTMFNRMLDQNEQLVRGSRDTLDNVAHDLRTPMTHLRNSAERALLATDPDPEILTNALADCVEESDQILQMLNLLMDLAEADAGSMNLHKEPVALAELADDVIELYSLVAEDREILLENNVPSGLSVSADRLRLRQSLGNLVDNALKYSPQNTVVSLAGERTDDGVEISVSDQGVGISREDLPRIWNRLYRGEQSRSTSGLGLGLSYVRAILTAHGGSVDVQARMNKGSTFILRLPHDSSEA